MTQPDGVAERVAVPMPPIEVKRRDLIWPLMLAMPLVGMHVITATAVPWGIWALTGGWLVSVVGLLSLKAFRARSAAAAEIVLSLTEAGLTLQHGEGPTRRMDFSEITRVVGVSFIDGYGESTMTLLIQAPGRQIKISGDLFYSTTLLQRLQQLPDWRREAYELSWANEDSFFDALWPKRTVLLQVGAC